MFQEAIADETAKEEAEEEDQAIDVKISTKGDRRKEIIIYMLYIYVFQFQRI